MKDCVYIGLGSNSGDRERHILQAVEALRRIDAVAVARCSSLYESPPLGPPQPDYLNAVVELHCGLRPEQLLRILQRLELDLGRRRTEERWGPRTIDLDILFWNGTVVAEPNLQVPHLELHNRRFAMEPLCELAPDLIHPLLGEPLRRLNGKLRGQTLVRVGSLEGTHLQPPTLRVVESR